MQREIDYMMRIILLGAPGSGKGTQAQFLMARYSIPKISTGEILRQAVKVGNKLGKKVKKNMEDGKLVTDELVISLVQEHITKKQYSNAFLLDGFPRTILQAEAMKKNSIHINYVLELDVPDALIVDRIVGRRIHSPSGRIYHVDFNPPRVSGKDDITGESLSTREDDQKEIVRKRLLEYRTLTQPLVDYYKAETEEGHIKYYKIDGTRPADEVSISLSNILG